MFNCSSVIFLNIKAKENIIPQPCFYCTIYETVNLTKDPHTLEAHALSLFAAIQVSGTRVATKLKILCVQYSVFTENMALNMCIWVFF